MAVCLIASVLAAQTGSPAPDAVLLDSKSASRMLLDEVKPEYPALAKVNYIQGAVRMQLRVTREGRVVEAHVVRGHPFLAEAALQAVRRWMYRPLRRGSQATEFSTFVDVRFALHGKKIDQMPPQPERDLDRQVRPPVLLRKPAGSWSPGSVRMRVLVGAKGQTLDSEPLAGTPSHFAAARHQVEQWTFRPARWGNHPVPWYLDVDVSVPD
jgi:TonB family protein